MLVLTMPVVSRPREDDETILLFPGEPHQIEIRLFYSDKQNQLRVAIDADKNLVPVLRKSVYLAQLERESFTDTAPKDGPRDFRHAPKEKP